MVSIKARGFFVFGIDYQRIGRNLGAHYTHERIGQQRGAEALSLEGLVYGKTSHSHCGNGGVTRQFLGEFGRQVANKHACRGQSAITRNAAVAQSATKQAVTLRLMSCVIRSLR